MTVDRDETDQATKTAFLGFLARHIELHPDRLKPLAPSLAARIAKLTDGVVVDLGTPIKGSVDI